MNPPRYRCIQIVASIEDRSAGPSYSVPNLADALQRHGLSTVIYTVRGWRQDRDAANDRVVETPHATYQQDFRNLPLLNRLCLSRQLRLALARGAGRGDILHGHGLWLMPNVYPAWVARRNGAKAVISPRGMLGREALQFSKLGKQLFWQVLQKSAAAAHCLHATSEQEYEEIRAFGLTNPVAIIPNGVDLPEYPSRTPPTLPKRTVLSLGRIHPKKGLDHLIRAWAKVEASFPDWQLVLVGPDELGYTRILRDLVDTLRLRRVSFENPKFGDDKIRALQGADLLVLPTLNDNFGLVVAEALAAGTPVISTRGAPWQEVESRGCGWWVDVGADALAVALNVAMGMPRSALRDMGAKGRAWVAEAFSWDKVAGDMLRVYDWLSMGGEVPSTVRLD